MPKINLGCFAIYESLACYEIAYTFVVLYTHVISPCRGVVDIKVTSSVNNASRLMNFGVCIWGEEPHNYVHWKPDTQVSCSM